MKENLNVISQSLKAVSSFIDYLDQSRCRFEQEATLSQLNTELFIEDTKTILRSKSFDNNKLQEVFRKVLLKDDNYSLFDIGSHNIIIEQVSIEEVRLRSLYKPKIIDSSKILPKNNRVVPAAPLPFEQEKDEVISKKMSFGNFNEKNDLNFDSETNKEIKDFINKLDNSSFHNNEITNLKYYYFLQLFNKEL